MKIPAVYTRIAIVCAFIYGMGLALLQIDLQLGLVTSGEQTKRLLYWALMPTIWIVKEIAPRLLGSISINLIATANCLLVFFSVFGLVRGAQRVKRMPNHPTEPSSPSRGGSS